MEEPIIICKQQENGVSVIRLNRPKVRNALNTELREKMAEIFIKLNDDPKTKAIVLTGGDKVFAAGREYRHKDTIKIVFYSHNDKDMYCEKCGYNFESKLKFYPEATLETGLCILFFSLVM